MRPCWGLSEVLCNFSVILCVPYSFPNVVIGSKLAGKQLV